MKMLVNKQIVFCIKVSNHYTLTVREKCPDSEVFWSVFSRLLTEYGERKSISPYLVRMRENTGQNNFKYGHFLCSVWYIISFTAPKITIFRSSFFEQWRSETHNMKEQFRIFIYFHSLKSSLLISLQLINLRELRQI